MARNLSRILSRLPKEPIFEASNLLPPSIFAAHLSSIPSRSMRGDRRTRDPSEDQFLRNLNFGDDEDGRDREKPNQSRPLRGERRPEPLRGERRSVGAPRENFEPSWQREAPQLANESKIGEHLKDLSGKDNGSHRPSGSLFEKLNLAEDFGRGGPKMEVAQQKSSAENPKTDRSVSESATPDADEIFRKMKETGLIPNAVAMLDGLCKDGLVQEAMKLFGLMREKGTIPEVVIYTAVVEGFCKAEKYDDARRIFRKMQKNGIVPNAFSYGVIIQGLCKGRRLEDSVEFCMEMLDSGHAPNPAAFAGLVNELCKEKGMEEAESFVRQLRERGFPTDDKPIRDHMDKKGPFSPMAWEVIFGKKGSQRLF